MIILSISIDEGLYQRLWPSHETRSQCNHYYKTYCNIMNMQHQSTGFHGNDFLRSHVVIHIRTYVCCCKHVKMQHVSEECALVLYSIYILIREFGLLFSTDYLLPFLKLLHRQVSSHQVLNGCITY